MRQCNGYVLIFVLVFLHIISLLSLFGLSLATYMLKSVQSLWAYERNSYYALLILQQVPVASAVCQVPPMDMQVLAQQPNSWWQQHACSGNLNEVRYYYVVSSLDRDSCGFIANASNNHELIAQYYRVTLKIILDGDDKTRLRWQAIIVTPVLRQAPCQQVEHGVLAGLQHWQEF